jgi:transcriptional regulator of heat shock response
MHTTTDKHEEKKENTEKMVDKNRKYNIESLQNESTKFLYQQRLTNKLNQNEFADMEEMYYYFKKCIHKAAKEALGVKEVNKGRKTVFCGVVIEKRGRPKKT